MSFFDSLSLRCRFLIAPLISVILTLIIFYTCNAAIQKHTDILHKINQANIPQVGEINRTIILLSKNHEKFEHLLHTAEATQDEEKIYLEGRAILNELHRLEEQLNTILGSSKKIIDGVDIFQQIQQNFNHFREKTINTIEVSTVQPQLAVEQMHDAAEVIWRLNDLFMILSDHYVMNLTEQSGLVKNSLYEESSITILSAFLLSLMVISALYFSRRMTSEIEQVNQSLIRLSSGEQDVELPDPNDKHNNMHKLYKAVHTFKQTLEQNKDQQDKLSQTIRQLTDSKERYLNLLDLVPTAIIATDDSLKVVLFNKAAEKIYGYSNQEMMGKPIEILVPTRHRPNIDLKYKKFKRIDNVPLMPRSGKPLLALGKSGKEFCIEVTAAKLTLENDTVMTFAVTDITDRIQAENEIRHKAHYDMLTGLPNRFLALECLTKGLEKARANSEVLTVFFLDLDGFKKINDSLGHETGDKLLIEAGRRLQNITPKRGTVARLGGDEFIVILGGLASGKNAIPTIQKIVEQFRKPFELDGRELILTSSIGISTFPEDGDSASELLRKADSAMYNAKDAGRNTYTFFTESMNHEVSRELALEEQMHGALNRQEFRLVYQLQVDIRSGKLIGAEALLRWDNHILGAVSPDEFIPIAEHTGLIVPISQFVLTESLRMAAFWQKTYSGEFRIAVNLSPRQFRDPNLIPFIEQALATSGVPADTLELEVTEGVLMSGHSFIDDALIALNKMGIRLAMDDFGTGYSSLSYLRRYSFDTLKIDRSFIQDIVASASNRELVNAIIAMAHALGLEIVAEGVETKMQLEFLAKRKCKYAQGYLFNQPLDATHVTETLERQKAAACPKLLDNIFASENMVH